MQARRVAAALAAAAMIGGCGDSGDGASGKTSAADKPSTTASTPASSSKSKSSKRKVAAPGTPVTKAQLIAKGDTACKAAKTKRNRLDRVGTAAQQIAALASQTDNKLIAKYVNVLQNELGLLRRLSFARKHKQASQEQFLLKALAEQRHRARVIAKEYGFKSCGSG